jgi:Pyridine nucleotide-disulphide oxidoreductase/Reductase C-terminal
MQREAGVDLRCGVSVRALEGDADGRLRRARLSDGTTLDVDVAIAALGSRRNTEWLAGSGLAAGRWGVACDAGCRAFDVNGVVTDDIFVAGDVARFPHPAYGYQMLAMEHWGNAVDQAGIAAHNMICAGPDRWPHLALPVFWSVQFGTEIKSIGVPTCADQVVITQGSVAERRLAAAYGRQGHVAAAVTFDQGMWLDFYGDLIDRVAPFPPRFRTWGGADGDLQDPAVRALAEPFPAATELDLLEEGDLLVVARRGLVPHPLLPGGRGLAGPRLGGAGHSGPSRCTGLGREQSTSEAAAAPMTPMTAVFLRVRWALQTALELGRPFRRAARAQRCAGSWAARSSGSPDRGPVIMTGNVAALRCRWLPPPHAYAGLVPAMRM